MSDVLFPGVMCRMICAVIYGVKFMSQVIIKGLETPEEQETAHDLMTKVHFPGYYPARVQLDSFIGNYPEFRREHTRLLTVSGQIVACLCIFTHTVRIGEARLKVGGIGNVTTAGPWRNRGYAALLMADTMHFLKSRGYHMSMLFGIADFYHRWGFASVLPEYTSAIELKEADAAAGDAGKHRAMKPGDIPAVLRIHGRNDADIACSIIRSSGHFTNRWERWREGRVVTDARGKVTAYFLGRPAGGEFQVDELGATDRSWHSSLLRTCLLRARQECAARIRFNVPPSHPFIHFLTQYRADHEMRTFRNSNGMMATVNLEETLECMTAEWESLVAVSSAANVSEEVTLVIDRRPFRIRVHHGAVDVAPVAGRNKVSLSQVEFIQLLTGYRYIDDVLTTKVRSVTAPAVAFLHLIFPKRAPYVWLTDRF